jgi:hypothetical protein
LRVLEPLHLARLVSTDVNIWVVEEDAKIFLVFLSVDIHMERNW